MMSSEFETLQKQIGEVRDLLKQLMQREVQTGIEEISLNRTARLLHLGSEKVIEFAESGRLKAMVDWDTNHNKRYRFRLSDIRAFQDARHQPAEAQIDVLDKLPTAAQLARNIFGQEEVCKRSSRDTKRTARRNLH